MRIPTTAARPTASILIGVALLAGCGRSTELHACKIADESCQRDISYAVVRLRGDGYDPFDGLPPIRTVTEEDYCKALFGDPPPEPPADMPDEEPEKPKRNPWDVALQRLGLVAPATTGGEAAARDLCQFVGAFYSWDTQSVTVIDRNGSNDEADTTLLAHELVHAFQDNEVAATPNDGTTDGSLAAGMLIEGEARMYEWLAYVELDDRPARQQPWHEWFTNGVLGERARLAASPSPFYSTWQFRYPLGGDRMMQGWLRGGNAAVRYLAKTAPVHTVDYMAAHAGLPAPAGAAVACRVTGPDDAFALVGQDRFGGLNLFAFLTANDMPEELAWETALTWRGDAVYVFFDEPGDRVAVTWRIRLADEAAAERVVAAAMLRPGLSAERRGSDALIVGSEAEDTDWRGALDCN